MRSNLTGRVVDSYTNILTVKLFARAARRGRVRARRDRRAHRRLPRPDADDHRLYRVLLALMNALLIVAHRGARDLAMERRADRGRRGGDGDAAGLADHQHRRLGGAQRHLDLREYRHGAGRHALDRRARGRCRTRRMRVELRVDRRRNPLRGRAFRLWPRARTPAPRRRAARHRPDDRAGRAGRAGRPVRRRQVDPGEPAAAFLRPRARPHPDRRAGHRRGDAGKPAHADRHGDAGHLAAAPLDQRQHPLRPAGGDARR